MTHLRYLVTGTGRCGTVYAARLLTSLGIPCGHEAVFDWRGYGWAIKRLNGEEPLVCSKASSVKCEDGVCTPIPDWVNPSEIVAESSYMAAPYLGSELLRGTLLIHIVRHPVDVINSFCNYIDYFKQSEPSNAYESFIYSHLPQLQQEMSCYDRAALYYIHWNKQIERATPNFFSRIEDGPEPIVGWLSAEQSVYDDRTANTRKKPAERFRFEQLDPSVRDLLLETTERYGYITDVGGKNATTMSMDNWRQY